MPYKDPEKQAEAARKHYQENVERIRVRERDRKREKRLDPEFRKEDNDRRCEQRRERRLDPEVRAAVNAQKRNRRKENIQFHLADNLRSRLYQALKRNCKSGSAVSDLGCSIEQLKSWLMYQFQPRMNWDNYGFGQDKWNIDHVKPLSSFDLTDRNQLLEAVNWYNLQPLWQPDNLSKGAK